MKLEEGVQEIKRRIDLVQVIGQTVKLKKHGPSYLGLCPFHPEKTPSFNVRPDRGYFKCFGCGSGGDVFTFLEKQTGQLFIDIVRRLAAELGISIDYKTKSTAYETSFSEELQTLQKRFEYQLKGEPLLYLTQIRHYSQEQIQKCALGYGGEHPLFHHRITIPIYNHRGQLVAFGGRMLPAYESLGPKYVNSPNSEIYEKSQVLYGLFESLSLIKQQKQVVLVEGYFDVVALRALGIPAVAPCGTSVAESHVDLLKKYTQKVLLCFDQDSAGRAAHQKALLMFLSKGFQVGSVSLDAKDPDTLWQQGEPEKLKEACLQAKDAVQVRIDQALEESLGGIRERIGALQSLLPFLGAHSDPLVNRQYLRLAARILGESEAALAQSVLRHKPNSLKIPASNPGPAKIIWTEPERLFLRALISDPLILIEHPELEEIDVNQDLKQFVSLMIHLEPGKSWEDIVLPKSSTVPKEMILEPMPVEGVQGVIRTWLKRVKQKKKNAWLREQHKKLLLISAQGDYELVRQALKEQSSVLRKSWT